MENEKGIKVIERLKSYAKEHGIPIARMERSIGKKAAYLSQVKNPTAEVLISVCETYPDIKPEWLLMGEHRQDGSTEVQDRKVEYYRQQLADAKMEIEDLKMQIHLRKR